MTPALLLPLVVLVAFTLYTATVVAQSGITAVIPIVLGEPWAGQLFVDLVIALSLFLVWMVRDARERGLPAWLYVALVATTGSIGALAYLVHRAARAPRMAETAPA